MPLISIIIPVYNAECYLSHCLDTILTQQMSDFEVLIVNDESSDNSLAICQEYAKCDCRVKVFDKPNGGVSSARNVGLDNAKGDYVMFVDADDWMLPEALALSMPYIPKYDIVKLGAMVKMPGGNIEKMEIKWPENLNDAMKCVVTRTIIVAPWASLIRRSIFEDNNIRFDTNIVIGEDWLVTAQTMLKAESFVAPREIYAYVYNRTNKNSCTSNLTFAKHIQQLEVLDRIKALVGNRYNREYIYAKALFITELKNAMRGADRAALVKWFKEPDNRKYLLSFKDILFSGVSLGKKNRLLQLWFNVNFL